MDLMGEFVDFWIDGGEVVLASFVETSTKKWAHAGCRVFCDAGGIRHWVGVWYNDGSHFVDEVGDGCEWEEESRKV